MTSQRKLSEDTMVVRANGMVTADMDGQWVMMNVGNGKYYSLNPVGSRIWDQIESPCTIKDLITALLAEYEVEEEQCQTSVSVFLNEMIANGLVAVV